MENRTHPTLPDSSSEVSSPEHPTRATLLVFTLGARCESRRRKLLPLAQKTVEDSLHQACLDTALAAGRAAGLRLEVSSPLELTLPADVDRRRQCGSSFGSRLTSAFERTFTEQGGPVVLVGSDVPDLEACHLRRTLKVLDEDPDNVVIGPSPDGGFYLLAAARPLGATLSKVRWRCRQTLSSLKHALRQQGRNIVLLAPLADLDRRSDLEHWLASLPAGNLALRWQDGLWRSLSRRLLEILADLRRVWLASIPPSSPYRAARVVRLRGPPLSA